MTNPINIPPIMIGQGDIQPKETIPAADLVPSLPKRRHKVDYDGPKWADFSYWFNEILAHKGKLKPHERIELAKWAIEFLKDTGKRPAAKAKELDPAALLAALESPSNRVGYTSPTEKSAVDRK